jgi:hypothetical protein
MIQFFVLAVLEFELRTFMFKWCYTTWTPSSFCFCYFWDRVSFWCLSILKSSHLCLLNSYDDKCMLPHPALLIKIVSHKIFVGLASNCDLPEQLWLQAWATMPSPIFSLSSVYSNFSSMCLLLFFFKFDDFSTTMPLNNFPSAFSFFWDSNYDQANIINPTFRLFQDQFLLTTFHCFTFLCFFTWLILIMF